MGAGKTERLGVSQRPSELAAAVVDAGAVSAASTVSADSTNGAVPASSAWGKSSPVVAMAPAKKSNIGLAIAGVVAVAVVGYFAARTLTAAPSPVVTNTTKIASAPPVVTPPEPKTTASVAPLVASPEPAPPRVVAPRPNITTPRPKPSTAPSASASAKPAPPPQPEGDFIKTRE